MQRLFSKGGWKLKKKYDDPYLNIYECSDEKDVFTTSDGDLFNTDDYHLGN